MTTAARATGAATILFGIVAVFMGVAYDPTTAVTMTIGHLRAGAIVAAVLHVGARVIAEIRAAGAADILLHTLADRRHGRGD